MRLVNQQLLKEVDRLTVLNFRHWLIKQEITNQLTKSLSSAPVKSGSKSNFLTPTSIHNYQDELNTIKINSQYTILRQNMKGYDRTQQSPSPTRKDTEKVTKRPSKQMKSMNFLDASNSDTIKPKRLFDDNDSSYSSEASVLSILKQEQKKSTRFFCTKEFVWRRG